MNWQEDGLTSLLTPVVMTLTGGYLLTQVPAMTSALAGTVTASAAGLAGAAAVKVGGAALSVAGAGTTRARTAATQAASAVAAGRAAQTSGGSFLDGARTDLVAQKTSRDRMMNEYRQRQAEAGRTPRSGERVEAGQAIAREAARQQSTVRNDPAAAAAAKNIPGKAIAAARPRQTEYTLWDGALAHFGVRVHPSGVKSFIVQTRVRGRMRKLTLGRVPETSLVDARREAAAVMARVWTGEAVAPVRKVKPPLFRDFAARYRERRKSRWKPSSLKTFDIYLRHRLMPQFGRLRLDTIDHARVSAWSDATSADKPGAANRAFEILRAMLGTARQWGDIGENVPDACANIVMNPRRPVARYLNREELERLGVALDKRQDERPWPVAAIRLLTLTGARLSEVLDLRWDEIGSLSEDGGSVRLEDSKTGPRTIWLGPEAARLVAALPRSDDADRVFPEDLTSARLYTFWTGVREEAGLHGMRIHDARHTWASQGVMNGVGLTTVGRLLGHRKRATTAIYAHLDDATLRDAAAQVAAVIAKAMGYKTEPSPLPFETEDGGGRVVDWIDGGDTRPTPSGSRRPVRHGILDRLAVKPAAPASGTAAKDDAEPALPPGWIRI